MKQRWNIFVLGILLCLPAISAMAQSDTTHQPPKFTIKGYVKYMEQTSFATDATQLVSAGLIHNRLNFKYEPNEHWKLRLEDRNRIYYGQLVELTPGFATSVTAYNAAFDWTKNWVNRNAVLVTSTIDRASVEWIGGKWDVTVGRQRINWGIGTVWTPNDIFNTFNYFDFDYEERPGADAARIQYNLNTSSSLDLAVSAGKTADQRIAALMYHWNKWDYDFQLFSGVYHQDVAAGLGWAGNIAGAGFKGEVTAFTPYEKGIADSTVIAASLSVDYGFRNGIYVLLSGLYNSAGADSLPNLPQLSTVSLSAKNIFPFRYAGFGEVSYSFTPIFKATLATLYSPSGDALILFPTLTYSLGDNWTLDFISQSFFGKKQSNDYGAVGNSFFLRLKWGF